MAHCNVGPRGRFVKGIHYSPATEFKKGRHWRKPRPHWDKAWLEHQYVTLKKATSEIAEEVGGITQESILHWLRKHGIPRRTFKDAARCSRRRTGLSGPANPMYGRRGPQNPNWKGGVTPARQMLYSSPAWRKARRVVWARDRKCRLCGHDRPTDLVIHHIIAFGYAPLLGADPNNLILVCEPCHKRMQGRERRWQKKLFAILKGGHQ